MKKAVIIIIGIICLLLLIGYISITFVILPVNSVCNKLLLLNHGGPYMNQITLNHYINDRSINSYILDLIVEPRYQIPQEYEIPQLENGSVEIIVDCVYDESFFLKYDDAKELYENGLLIYTMSDFNTTIEIDGIVSYDRYMYFRSGKNQKTFVQKAGTTEWIVVDDPPKLKKFEREWKGYSPIPYEENRWSIQH